MFSTANSKRVPVSTNYQPTKIPGQEVLFQPMKSFSGPSVNYVALIDNKEKTIGDYDSDNDESDDDEEPPFQRLYRRGDIYSSAPLAMSPASAPPPPSTDIFSLGNDTIKSFYIGSITVVGLYILYKILNKRN